MTVYLENQRVNFCQALLYLRLLLMLAYLYTKFLYTDIQCLLKFLCPTDNEYFRQIISLSPGELKKV